jgi:GT2 family glycosyltransferase
VTRPGVCVIVPFFGSAAEAQEALERLGTLERGAGDRIVLADNTPDAVAAGLPGAPGVEVLVCESKRTAYGARNEAAAAAGQEWLLFLDDDCRPEPDILDRYFEPPPAGRTGLVSGSVGGLEGQPGFVPGYARSRNHLDQEFLATSHVFRPMGVTANLLVRRSAWEEAGGFAELVRSGADGDFCWRVQDLGWNLEHRPGAGAPHVHRASVREAVRKAARDGAANPWLARRWPGYPARIGMLRQVVRAAGGVPVWLLRGKPRRAAYKAFDVLWVLAADLGTLTGNRIPRAPATGPTFLVAQWPEPGAPAPPVGRVEALRRPLPVQDWRAGRVAGSSIAEDDGPLDRWRALGALALRRPLAVAGALARDRRRACALAPAALRLRAAGGGLHAGADVVEEAAVLRRLAGS